MSRTSRNFLTLGALAGILFAGCEWTASDGHSTWNSKYDSMNFSGTYRVGTVAGGGGAAAGATTNGKTETRKVGTWKKDSIVGEGTLVPDIVPSSVKMWIEYPPDPGTGAIQVEAWTDDAGDGKMVGSGAGTIQYVSGAFRLTLTATPPSSSVNIMATYTYNSVSAPIIDSDADIKAISHITVNQTGQNLQMLFTNGLDLKGKFTTVNEFDTGFNASFEVSGNGAKFIGTLNSGAASRQLDGSLVVRGGTYDISAAASGSAGTLTP
jgi:hypothetical protein